MPKSKKPPPTPDGDELHHKSSLRSNMSAILRGGRPPPATPAEKVSQPVPAPHLPANIASLDEILSMSARPKPSVSVPSQSALVSPAQSSASPWSAAGRVARLNTGDKEKEKEKGPITERMVRALLDKFKEKLPVFSGLTLHDLARDAALSATISIFCNLASSSPQSSSSSASSPSSLPPTYSPPPSVFSPALASASSRSVSADDSSSASISSVSMNTQSARGSKAGAINLVVLGLCDMLERVRMISAPPTQTLHSQVFLLQTLTIVLGARMRPPSKDMDKCETKGGASTCGRESVAYSPTSPPTSPSSPLSRPPVPTKPLPDPPTSLCQSRPAPLDTHVAHQALRVLLPFFRPDKTPNTLPSFTSPTSSTNRTSTSPISSISRINTSPTTGNPTVTAIPTSPRHRASSFTLSKHPTTSLPPTHKFTGASLTPIPRIPLHGFEDFPPPHIHLHAGLLNPAAVWSTPPPASSSSDSFAPQSHSSFEVQQYTELHANVDTRMHALAFLSPALLGRRFAARSLYFLSAGGNWDDVVRLRGEGRRPGTEELTVLGYCAMERDRLARVFRDLASAFNSPSFDVVLAAAAVRMSIFAWLEHAPAEFHAFSCEPSCEPSPHSSPHTHSHMNSLSSELSLSSALSLSPSQLSSCVGVEGAAKLYDAISTLVDRSDDRTKAALWTAMGALLCVCPDMLERGDEHALFRQLLAPDVALRVYSDVCRAAFFLPPECEGCPLKAVARDVAEDLAKLIEKYPPGHEPDSIDVDLYADALVAVYRHSPARALPLMRGFLERERSEAVKLCFVRAAMTLVVEADAFPWQPSLVPLLQTSTKRLNLILRALLRDGEESDSHPAALRPFSLAHPQEQSWIRRVLLLSVQGLLRLDIAFFLYGPSLDDLSAVNREGVHVLSPPRDHGMLMMCLSMYATWIERARAVQRGDTFHREAVAYMNASVLTTLFACAQEVVHVWHNTENILCVHAVHHILKILADMEDNGEDTSWKLSDARLPALAMTELALITAYKSAQPEISTVAAQSFAILGKVTSDPHTPIPSYLSREQLQLWSPYLRTMVEAKFPNTGGAALQKAIRKQVTSHVFPCATHISGWKECYYRWSMLAPIVSKPEGSMGPPPGLEMGPDTYKDRQVEWTNHTLALATAGRACLGEVDPSFVHLIGTHLPERFPMPHEPVKLLMSFIVQLVDLLVAETVHARETAKDALGSELNLQVVPLLFEHLNSLVPQLLLSAGSPPEPHVVMFIDQCIAVLTLIADRVWKDDNYFLKCDMGQFLLPMARFLDRTPACASEVRSKTLFCELIEKLRKRRDIFTLRWDDGIRNILLDMIMNWTREATLALYSMPSKSDMVREQRRCQTAALRMACNLAENLLLQPLDGSAEKDTQHVVSRLFHRYLTILVKTLDFSRDSDVASPKSEGLSLFSGGFSVNIEAHIVESVIDGIAHLVIANTNVGLKQCVEMGYDEDFRLRGVFMKVFSRVLRHGTRFDAQVALKPGSKQCQLSELVRSSEVLADAIAAVCTPSEIEVMVPVLLNVLDTRRSMLGLLKRLIVLEITNASSPTDVFRQNNMCNRLLSAFAKHHGYSYLRLILEPLIQQLLELPVGCSFELDPAKLQPGEERGTNAQVITNLTQAFIEHVTASAPSLPSVLVDICHHISQTVSDVWPNSRHSAVGGFLFLRFICPAVVSPEVVDLDVAPDKPPATSIRRGLVLVAKIIQNLANNIMFGKEAHLVFLNPFLESNIARMSNFLGDSFTTPSADHDIDHWLGASCDDTDTFILQRFFQVHHEDVGTILLDPASEDPPMIQTPNKHTWVRLCEVLVDLGTLIDSPTPAADPAASNIPFIHFMSQNAHRNTEGVQSIFYVCNDQPDVFVLRLEDINVELTDLELLMCHIFRTLKDYLSSPSQLKVVIDCTRFTPESELPLEWLKFCVELTPSDIRQKIGEAYILNANSLAQKFLRKLFYICSGISFASRVHAVASVSELFNLIPRIESIATNSSAALEDEGAQVYENVHVLHVHRTWTAVRLEVRTSHLRVTSGKIHAICPTLACNTVEVVPLDDVDDIYRVACTSTPNEFVLARNKAGITMQFSSPDRDEIIQAIRSAKSHAESSGLTMGRFGGLSDITATLLTIGLVNTCHDQEWPRGAANMLLAAVCIYLKYEAVVAILPAQSNSIILNPAGAIVLFSERMAAFAPHLTLDLLTDFRLGFNKASTHQKITCLSYLPPWIRNLVHFINPASALYDQSGTKIRDAIRSLVDITLRDNEVYHSVQQHIWTEIAKTEQAIINVATDELIRVAIDGSVESRRCDVVADVIMALSSIHLRSRIVTRLRQALRKSPSRTSRIITTSAPWNDVAVLSRLALAASHTPRSSVQNELLLPETAHLVTMLAATGPVSMRTSVYGMAVNVLHAISASRIDDDATGPELRRYAEEASGLATVHLFGLSQNQSSMEYAATKSLSDQIDHASLEAITQMLLRAFTTGAGNPGLLNVWRARWMSLVTASAFQEFPYMQTRAFTVLSILVDSNLDDDFFYQILVALKNAIRNSPDGDSSTVLSMLRCMCKLIPKLVDHSRYLPSVFWVAVALLQTGHLPYYVQSMNLVHVALTKLQTQGTFCNNSASSVLLSARSQLSNQLAEFDQFSGFCFVDEISFSISLASLLFAVAQHQTLRPVAGETILAVLRILARSNQKDSGDRPMTYHADPSIVGFVLASLRFCTTVPSLRTLLDDANVDVSQWESNGLFGATLEGGETAALPFSLLGASDARSAGLVIASIFAMLELYDGGVPEREMLWALLKEANEKYPSVLLKAQVHHFLVARTDWVEVRVAMAYGAQTTRPILEGMSSFLNSLIGYEDQWDATNASTSTLSTSSELTSTAHYQELEELGMQGLLTHMRHEFGHTKDQFVPTRMFESLLGQILVIMD